MNLFQPLNYFSRKLGNLCCTEVNMGIYYNFLWGLKWSLLTEDPEESRKKLAMVHRRKLLLVSINRLATIFGGSEEPAEGMAMQRLEFSKPFKQTGYCTICLSLLTSIIATTPTGSIAVAKKVKWMYLTKGLKLLTSVCPARKQMDSSKKKSVKGK